MTILCRIAANTSHQVGDNANARPIGNMPDWYYGRLRTRPSDFRTTRNGLHQPSIFPALQDALTQIMPSSKRQLDFRTADQVIAEIEHLRTVGYTKIKNWNLSQCCEHLQKTMNGGMNGFGFRMPWIVRATAAKWIFGWMLRNRKMVSAPTINKLKPLPLADQENDQQIDDCIHTIRTAESFARPIEDYPFLDNLSVDVWQQLMWLHAAHHLGFLIPSQDTP
ncbi:MAG: DUF1569 domain-containing protein [Rubripirellula sp.]|nr:DUF1569 domain-containing protein [Rubripirellula sp.]